MTRRTLAAILVAVLVVLAGCGGASDGAVGDIDSTTAPAGGETANDGATDAGGSPGGDGSDDGSTGESDATGIDSRDATGGDGGGATDGDGGASGSTAASVDSGTDGAEGDDGGSGSVQFYVSDERNAISDFEHLDVTIEKIGLKPAGDDGETDGNETDDSETIDNETIDNETTETVDDGTTDNETDDSGETATATPTENTSALTADAPRAIQNGTDGTAKPEADGAERAGWVEYDVDAKTFDLTTLQGAKASRLANVTVPEGEYNKVFIHVSSIEGTLTDGTEVNVKLPSQKLQLNKGLTVTDGESVDFVYDATVFRAGKSGKYVLKPVVSESGTSEEVDIEDVEPDDATGLTASFVGDAEPGASATVEAFRNGTPVGNATVSLNGSVADETNETAHWIVAGETDETGQLTVSIPENATAVTVRVTAGNETVGFTERLVSDGPGGRPENAGNGNGSDNGGGPDGPKRGNGNGKGQ